MVNERRVRYREVMRSSIEEARNEAIREVLTSFRDWVLSYNKWIREEGYQEGRYGGGGWRGKEEAVVQEWTRGREGGEGMDGFRRLVYQIFLRRGVKQKQIIERYGGKK